MKLRQPDQYTCGPTALANLFNLKLDLVIKQARKYQRPQGYNAADLIYTAAYFNRTLCPFVEGPRYREFGEYYAVYDGILMGIKPNGRGHALTKLNRELIDPATGELFDNSYVLRERVFLAWIKS
jgi:hypothetical protein